MAKQVTAPLGFSRQLQPTLSTGANSFEHSTRRFLMMTNEFEFVD